MRPNVALPELLLVVALCPTATGQLQIFVSEDSAYRYVNATASTTIASVPPDWYRVGFDDSSWFVGLGAFGTSFGPDLGNAVGPGTPNATQHPGQTAWDVFSDPYLRTSFVLAAPTNLTIWFAVDNGVQEIYLNGIRSTVTFNNNGQAHRWEHVLDVPASYTRPGTNLIALKLDDFGVATGFAMVVTEDNPADEVDFSSNPGTGFCYGSQCPCQNDDISAGCANSTGNGGRLEAAGSASLASDAFVLLASNLPAFSNGVLYFGMGQTNVPFGDGLRCVVPGPPSIPFLRFPVKNSGSSGQYAFGPGLSAEAQQFLGISLAPGQTWHFQVVYRDVAGPCAERFNFTNGLSITMNP